MSDLVDMNVGIGKLPRNEFSAQKENKSDLAPEGL